MMPPRYGNMHRTAGTGPSSMMAAAVVTAATCAQEEKIQKHITPTETGMLPPSLTSQPSPGHAFSTLSIFPFFLLFYLFFFSAEHSVKAKKLCEMATQTIALSSIFTSLDGNAYNQIPYADQYVPNNTTTATPTAEANDEQVVVNNNKINQQQHGQPAQSVAAVVVAAGNHIVSSPAVPTATATATPVVAATTVATVTTAASADVAIAPAEATSNGSRRGPVLQTNL